MGSEPVGSQPDQKGNGGEAVVGPEQVSLGSEPAEGSLSENLGRDLDRHESAVSVRSRRARSPVHTEGRKRWRALGSAEWEWHALEGGPDERGSGVGRFHRDRPEGGQNWWGGKEDRRPNLGRASGME